MKKEEKIKTKLEETEGKINGAFLLYLVALLLEMLLLIAVSRAIENATTLKIALGAILMCGLGWLIYLETTWFLDYVSARFRALANVIKVAFYQTKDFEFIGEKEKGEEQDD